MYFRSSEKVFAHIDCNSFYASCEVLRNPSLKGKCVCVWDQLIIAASYEAKKLWIKTGTPMWEAERILGKKLVKRIPDHAWYRQVSDRFTSYLSERLWKVEIFSIDELFAEVTHCTKTYSAFAEKLKEEIYHDIWIPVSIGISNTRIRAKMFWDINKPYGSYVSFARESIENLFKELPVTEVPYIARWNSERLGYGVKTVFDFYSMDGMTVKEILGRNGVTLWLELHWVDSWLPHDTEKKRKSIVCSRSFNHGMTDNPNMLWREILSNFERAYETMLAEKQWARVIWLLFRTKEFQRMQQWIDMWEVNIDRQKMLESLRTLFKLVYTPGVIYRTTGVTFIELSSFTPKQLSVFDMPDKSHMKNEKISNALTKIKERYWDSCISQGLVKRKKKMELGVLFEVN